MHQLNLFSSKIILGLKKIRIIIVIILSQVVYEKKKHIIVNLIHSSLRSESQNLKITVKGK